jgi:TolA-binding protein
MSGTTMGERDDAPSPALFKPSVPAPYRRVGAASSSSVSSSSHSSSLKTNIEELRLKVERMKGELKVKSQAIKELQSELSRLTSGRGEGTLCAGSLISVRQEAGASASDMDRANQHSEGTEQRGLEETRGLPLEGHSLPPLLPLSLSLSLPA